MDVGTGFVAPVHVGATSFAGQRQFVCRDVEPAAVRAPPIRRAQVHMRSSLNMQKKKDKVTAVKESIEDVDLLFQVPLPGLTVAQVMQLKDTLPEGTKCMTVKNTLMKRAIEGTEWSVVGDMCSQSTVWFFVKGDLKPAIKAYTKFAKENKRDPILGGAFESSLYDRDGVEKLGELPTKQELYQKTAILIKAVPTKLARTVKAVPVKLARAINLAVNDPDKEAPAAEA